MNQSIFPLFALTIVLGGCRGGDTTAKFRPSVPISETTTAPLDGSGSAAQRIEAPASSTLAGQDVLSIARSSGKFSEFLDAVERAGLSTVLDKGQHTVFAPNDDAFSALSAEERARWLSDPEMLSRLVRNHILPNQATSRDLVGQSQVRTMGGSHSISGGVGTVQIGNARVVTPDIMATNGVIHELDSILVPRPNPEG